MRILKAVVIVMAVLIFVGLGVLVWGLFNISSKDGGAPLIAEPAGTGNPKAFGQVPLSQVPLGQVPLGRVSLGLPPGCDIAEAAADAGRLIVRTSCGEVRVVDLATGKTLGVIER